jgi:hypothetical protein
MNFYTNVSFIMHAPTLEAGDNLIQDIDIADIPLDIERMPDRDVNLRPAYWLYAEDSSITLEELGDFLSDWLSLWDVDGKIVFTYAHTASRPVPHCYGGGYVVVTATDYDIHDAQMQAQGETK